MLSPILRIHLSDEAVIFLVIGIIFLLMIILRIRLLRVISHSQKTFTDIHFSSQPFYKSLEALIKSRNIPEVSVSKVFHSQHGAFSSKREYLQITRQDYVFEVCAAPFGGDFFISTRLMEREPNLFARIPVLKKIFRLTPEQKTFYELDTEAMFRGSIQACVDKVTKKMVAVKGVRALKMSPEVKQEG